MNAPILVPLDGSHLAETAIPYAVAQANRDNTPLLLVRAEPIPPFVLVPEAGVVSVQEYQRETDQLHKEALAYLNAKAEELTADGLTVSTLSDLGDPVQVVLKAARDHSVMMIVLATHGRTGVNRWFFGSVAEDILRHSPVPVLLVRAQYPTE